VLQTSTAQSSASLTIFTISPAALVLDPVAATSTATLELAPFVSSAHTGGSHAPVTFAGGSDRQLGWAGVSATSTATRMGLHHYSLTVDGTSEAVRDTYAGISEALAP
jgi:hypothetical protein